MKRRYVLTFFAVFTATLMVMTTTISGPIQERENTNIINNVEEEITNSIEMLCLKIENDQELLYLIEQLTNNDDSLNSIATSIENSEDSNEKKSLINEYKEIVENKEGISEIKQYLSNKYCEDIKNIKNQFIAFTDFSEIENTVNSKLDRITENNFEIGGYLPLAGAIYHVESSDITEVSDSSISLGSPDNTISDPEADDLFSEDLTQINDADGDDSTYGGIDSSEGHWAGFLRNQDGGKLIPGHGWVYPGDEDWEFWSGIEDSLKTLPMRYATELLDEIVAIFNDYGPTGPIWDLIIEIIEEIIRIINDVIDNIIYFLGDVLIEIIVGIITILFAIYVIIYEILDAILEFLEGITP